MQVAPLPSCRAPQSLPVQFVGCRPEPRPPARRNPWVIDCGDPKLEVVSFFGTEAHLEGPRNPGSPTQGTPLSTNFEPLGLSGFDPSVLCSRFTTGGAAKLTQECDLFGFGIPELSWFINRLFHPKIPAPETSPRKTAPSATTGGKPGVGPFPPPDSPSLRKLLQLSIA